MVHHHYYLNYYLHQNNILIMMMMFPQLILNIHSQKEYQSLVTLILIITIT